MEKGRPQPEAIDKNAVWGNGILVSEEKNGSRDL